MPEQYRSNARMLVAIYLLDKGADATILNRAQFSSIDYVQDKDAKYFLVSRSYRLKLVFLNLGLI